MRLITYNSDYRLQLQQLFLDYFNEVHPDEITGDLGDAGGMIDMIIDDDKSIYLVIDKEVVVAYLVVFLHGQYHMTKETVYCEYMYVAESHRSTRAVMYLYGMIGKICNEYQADAIGTTFHTSSNISNNRLVEGEPIATTFRFDLQKQQKYSSKYIKRMR